jgi:hypothetical protein
MERTDGGQDVCGIHPLRAPRLDPAPAFTRRQERIEQALSCLMGEHAAANIMQQGEVKASARQVEAEGIFPIHAAADGIGYLAVGEAFDVRHHHNQRSAPGRDFHGTPLGWIEIGEELIIVEPAELGTELHREVALGKRGRSRRSRRLWH